jgi:hypothetical protein
LLAVQKGVLLNLSLPGDVYIISWDKAGVEGYVADTFGEDRMSACRSQELPQKLNSVPGGIRTHDPLLESRGFARRSSSFGISRSQSWSSSWTSVKAVALCFIVLPSQFQACLPSR